MRKTYYEYLLEELEDFRMQGKDTGKIRHIPDFFKLLSDMLDHDELDRDARQLINSALGYFVSPDDVLPDDIYGPEGYMDDLYVCAYILKKLYPDYSDIMESAWQDNERLEDAIGDAYENSNRYLEEKEILKRIMEYSGL